MNLGFGFVLVAVGSSLLYKGYRGWSWAEFYSVVLAGRSAPTTGGSTPASKITSPSVKTASGALGSLLAPGIGTLTGKKA